MDLGGSGDGNDPRRFRQEPGERDLGRGRVPGRGQAFQDLDQGEIVVQGLRLEPGLDAAKIAWRHILDRGDGAGQETLAQRGIGHKPDAQFRAGVQKAVGLDLARPQRIFVLKRRDRLDRVRAPQRGGGGFAHAEMLHLALGDQVLDGPGHLLDRNLGVHAVLIEEIKGFNTQTLERSLAHPADPGGAGIRAVHGAGIGINVKAELGGDDHLVLERRHRRAHNLFIDPGAVDFGGVKKGHAIVERGADQGDARRLVQSVGIAETDAHAAEAEGGDFQAGAAEFAGFHSVTSLMSA